MRSTFVRRKTCALTDGNDTGNGNRRLDRKYAANMKSNMSKHITLCRPSNLSRSLVNSNHSISSQHEPEMAPLNAQRLVVVHTALFDLQPGST
jgi:hypothetical protein